mmetsp:Transcript_10652/g.15945  ORF Transcript_10652/g.15945 Transcript_10652/m.15945 type:complete len:107 (+) Transcript_10652:59-379(+)
MNNLRANFKTTLQLYRDCLRLANHIGGQGAKGKAMRGMIALEFRKHLNEKDKVKIDDLKMHAVRGLSNYMVHESSGKNRRLKEKMDEQRKEAQRKMRAFNSMEENE